MTDPLPERVAGLPRRHPAPEVLELVELELDGALPAGYLGSRALLGASDEVAAALEGGGGLVLEDAEGTPVAALLPDATEPTAPAAPAASAASAALVPLRPFTHGPLRRHRRSPAEVRAELGVGDEPVARRGVLGAVVTDVLGSTAAEDIKAAADHDGRRVLWLVVVGSHRHAELSHDGLLRAVRALHGSLGLDGVVVPVAVPGHLPEEDLMDQVAAAYGAGEVLSPSLEPGGRPHPAFARELARQQHPAHARGVTVFFTGLSGSGKSTVAKALAERIDEDSTRAVTLLDGDEVRRLLSAGLTFSREDRDLNIRRIGYVATEVTRHGGVAICAPIAPFDAVRREVRRSVDAVGDFILVHVATPLDECERRDRKGLYAKARRGEIPDFTGISSPYEAPDDAELRLDTTDRSIDDCVDQVWDLLNGHGYLG